jgi:hypothetical protein
MKTIEIRLELDDRMADQLEAGYRDGVPVIILPQDAKPLNDCAPFVVETYIPGEPNKYDLPQDRLAR